jgi:hypothetical protein
VTDRTARAVALLRFAENELSARLKQELATTTNNALQKYCAMHARSWANLIPSHQVRLTSQTCFELAIAAFALTRF